MIMIAGDSPAARNSESLLLSSRLASYSNTVTPGVPGAVLCCPATATVSQRPPAQPASESVAAMGKGAAWNHRASDRDWQTHKSRS